MSESHSPRPTRYGIHADAEIIDSMTGRVILAKTSDVSLGGCYIEAPQPLDVRSTVRVKLFYDGATASAYADVVRADVGKGMGLRFRGIAPEQIAVIKRWLFATDRPDY